MDLILINLQAKRLESFLHRVLFAQVVNERIRCKRQDHFRLVELGKDRPNGRKRDVGITALVKYEDRSVATTTSPYMTNDLVHPVDECIVVQLNLGAD